MSSKELKKKLREEKKQSAKRRERMQGIVLKIASAVMVVLVVYVFYQGLFGGAQVYAPSQVAESDHIRGAENAGITLTVYGDFQCPACYTETQLIARAWPQISGRVRLVFRHFPLDIHNHAFEAARYAEAAASQGRFWEMHDLLYINQQLWTVMDDATGIFEGYAMQLGLDMEQLQADLASDAARSKIIADRQGGIRAGVRSTPSIFINGRMVNNPRSSGELIEMIERAESDPV